jgi:lysyl-tRNA synthetase, class II
VSEKEIVQQRLDKVQKLRAAGIEPYAYAYARTHRAVDVATQFTGISGDAMSPSPVAVAGRLMTVRAHGKTVFAHLQDETGRVQLYFRLDQLGPERFEWVKQLDLGDIIGARGPVFRTHTGELTVRVDDFTLLTKALLPLPEKWHGLKDVEVRYRQRYLDLLANERTRQIFLARSRIVKEIRAYLDGLGFLEVETPMMHPIAGGAAAKPFSTHHNALDRDLFLRIAPELYLKRLLVGGFEKVYEINRNFRNEGISTMHNPEFTMLEAYQAYVDGSAMMSLTENLFAHLATVITGGTELTYQGQALNLAAPWRRLPMQDAVRQAVGVNAWEQSPERLRELCREAQIPVPDGANGKEALFDLLFKHLVEPKLIQPTFIVDFPIELSPLAKTKPGHPQLADRFEPYIVGHEFANGFSELSDPEDQRRRFEAQMEKRVGGDEEAHRIDLDYVRALEYGLPPAGGLGVGIDRLVMLLTDSPSIREVILFPQLRELHAPEAQMEDEEGPLSPS